MSFGFSPSDAVLLVQLAWKTVQNARRACGYHEELTQELVSVHAVLRRLQGVAAKAFSPINSIDETYGEELEVYITGCRKVLHVLDNVLTKYNALSQEERSVRKLWQSIKFGNGQIVKLRDQRERLRYFTSGINLLLSFMTADSTDRMTLQLGEADDKLQDIRNAVNHLVMNEAAKAEVERSVFTNYSKDDRNWWRQFRRGMIQQGFPSSKLKKHQKAVEAYIHKIGGLGGLDAPLGEEVGDSDRLNSSGAPDTESDSGADNSLQQDEILLHYWERIVDRLRKRENGSLFPRFHRKPPSKRVANSYYLDVSVKEKDDSAHPDPETRHDRLLSDGTRDNETDSLRYERFKNNLFEMSAAGWSAATRTTQNPDLDAACCSKLYKSCWELHLRELLLQINDRKLPYHESRCALQRAADTLIDIDNIDWLAPSAIEKKYGGDNGNCERYTRNQRWLANGAPSTLVASAEKMDQIWHHLFEQSLPFVIDEWVLCNPEERMSRAGMYEETTREIECYVETLTGLNLGKGTHGLARRRNDLIAICDDALLSLKYFKASQEQRTQQWLWRDNRPWTDGCSCTLCTGYTSFWIEFEIDTAQRVITTRYYGRCEACFPAG